MADFLRSLVRAAIWARAREMKIKIGKKALKKLPERIPLGPGRMPLPAIPPPRILPPGAGLPPRLPVPGRDEIPVPRPSTMPAPSPEQVPAVPVPIPQVQQVQPKIREMPPPPRGVPEGYTKIVLPASEDEIPVPEATKRAEAEATIDPMVEMIKPKPIEVKKSPIRVRPKPAIRVRPVARAKPVVRVKPVREKPRRASTPVKLSADLGTITDFIRDPYVKAIEYDDGKLKVITAEGENEKGTLTEEEAKKIVENFAKAAGAKMKPAFEVELGGLKMSAVISEILGVKFSITKVS